ncbi:MAG: hypothetical protein ACLUGQ_08700 [Coprococcus sp.]
MVDIAIIAIYVISSLLAGLFYAKEQIDSQEIPVGMGQGRYFLYYMCIVDCHGVSDLPHIQFKYYNITLFCLGKRMLEECWV